MTRLYNEIGIDKMALDKIAYYFEQSKKYLAAVHVPEERKAEFLKMAGIWSDTEEGEEYYQMMKHRNDGRPLNREIILDD